MDDISPGISIIFVSMPNFPYFFIIIPSASISAKLLRISIIIWRSLLSLAGALFHNFSSNSPLLHKTPFLPIRQAKSSVDKMRLYLRHLHYTFCYYLLNRLLSTSATSASLVISSSFKSVFAEYCVFSFLCISVASLISTFLSLLASPLMIGSFLQPLSG